MELTVGLSAGPNAAVLGRGGQVNPVKLRLNLRVLNLIQGGPGQDLTWS